MEPWRQWLEMAETSLEVASLLGKEPKFARSAASRFYYAAYQAMTAVLLYAGHQPPLHEGEPRECWSHELTPLMLVNNLGGIVRKSRARRDMQRRLRELYKARVFADYVAGDTFEFDRLREIRKDATFLLKVAQDILPVGQ